MWTLPKHKNTHVKIPRNMAYIYGLYSVGSTASLSRSQMWFDRSERNPELQAATAKRKCKIRVEGGTLGGLEAWVDMMRRWDQRVGVS